LRRWTAEGLDNIRLYDDDATQVLDWLPDAVSRSHRSALSRSLAQEEALEAPLRLKVNLDRFARVLKPGGRFGFASDIDTYVNWTLAHIAGHPQFEWMAAEGRGLA
jgi:tRNA (guanine-N7-)-methyltransferase